MKTWQSTSCIGHVYKLSEDCTCLPGSLTYCLGIDIQVQEHPICSVCDKKKITLNFGLLFSDVTQEIQTGVCIKRACEFCGELVRRGKRKKPKEC